MSAKKPHSTSEGADLPTPPLRLNIVILFMGSRGDLQPSLAIAKRLQRRYGHRVRIASHAPYRTAVEAAGVDFFSIGSGDVKRMMERRLLPRDELRREVPAIKKEYREMGRGWWRACIDDDGGGDDDDGGRGGMEQEQPQPRGGFVADAIVSTMLVFNQTSAAARLGIPLHLYGMNPRTFSTELPHAQAGWAVRRPSWVKNVFSWWFQDVSLQQTIKSVINDVRISGMGLEAMSPAWWLSQHNRMDVPCTYLWSPRLLDRPSDWRENVEVAGFVFEDVPEGYVPPSELVAFLEAGGEAAAPPVYVGFGSMSFPDARRKFCCIFEAARRLGVRIVFCRGWSGSDIAWEDDVGGGKNHVENGDVAAAAEGGGAGAGAGRDMSHAFVIDEAPHAWLFPRVRAVVCHGGSGTTAMALRSGRPTLVVPVAGDQRLWGARVHAVGCGPEATLDVSDLDADKFIEKLAELLSPRYKEAAEAFAARMAADDERPGEDVCAERVVESCLRAYGVAEGGRCVVFPERPAVWRTREGGGRGLSAVAAHVLVEAGKIRWDDLRAAEVVKWPDLVSPGDPFTGMVLGVGEVVGNIFGDVKRMKAGARVAILHLLLHILRAPLTILSAMTFGLFNLVDFILYELNSPFTPKLYASNPRLYTYTQMLLFLVSAPLVELGSVVVVVVAVDDDEEPTTLAKQGKRRNEGPCRPRIVFSRVPLALVRTLLALANLPIGFVGISLRQAELYCARRMGERPVRDVVAEARMRQGKIEAEAEASERAETGGVGAGFREDLIRAWDASMTDDIH